MAECNNCLHRRVCKYAEQNVSAGIAVKDTVHECVDCAPMAEWIDVKDRLPESGVWVLCFCQGNIYDVLKWNAEQWGWDKDKNHNYFRPFVKCWMPLPEPPKGEVENG